MKQLRVTVQGKVYEVTVEILDEGGQPSTAGQTPLSVMSASASPSVSTPVAAASAGGPGSVGSPLAGKVVSMQVTAGQAVKQGDQLIVLEAMKMNTYVYAPQDGVVAEILANVGDSVAEGQALLRIVEK
jgi:biotin carboxyl carrier protein